MGGNKPPYPPQFRVGAVRQLQESGQPISRIAAELGVSHASLRSWRQQDQVDAGKRERLTSAGREELKKLRRENWVLREEREILEKAAACFAQETHRTR